MRDDTHFDPLRFGAFDQRGNHVVRFVAGDFEFRKAHLFDQVDRDGELFDQIFGRGGAVGFVVGIDLFSDRALFGVEGEDEVVGTVLFVEGCDEVDKSC